MDTNYRNLKTKLEDLGYHQTLPYDAVSLVECLLADLLQTTRSLQNYMEISKDAITQRDAIMSEAEPYRCENAKLIQENNRLHLEVMELSEEIMKITKESRRKIKTLNDLIAKKESDISKLQLDLRELSMRGICAETLSSQRKRKDISPGRFNTMRNNTEKYAASTLEKDTQLCQYIQELEDKIKVYSDEVTLLKSQVDHRDSEIFRLNILLEGGSNIKTKKKDCKYQSLLHQIQELQKANETLQNNLSNSLEKQHEAMFRALKLADKNTILQDELKKVDAMALQVEQDCNKKIAEMKNELTCMQTKLKTLNAKNSELEKELAKLKEDNSPTMSKIQELLNNTLSAREEALQKEIKDLAKLNESLLEKIAKKNFGRLESQQYIPSKKDLQDLDEERRQYDKHVQDIQQKLSHAIDIFNKHIHGCKNSNVNIKSSDTQISSIFLQDLQNKLCEREQKILMLKKEIEELHNKLSTEIDNSKDNFKDVIRQLNSENTELSKENIALSKELCSYKIGHNLQSEKEHATKEIRKLKLEIEQLTNEIQILKKDKDEYNLRLKEANDSVNRLRSDLVYKHKEIESLQEENNSYRMTHRTEKASYEHLKEECNFLREQTKILQTDIIKEKTLSSQIKNIQLETERNYSETQNELQSVQKKLSIANNMIEQLEKKCKDLENEIVTLRNNKSNLMGAIKCVDVERDKLVIELDKKTENMCILEQKCKSQTFEITKLQNEISDLKRRLTVNKVNEHKIVDSEKQISFLNCEILRLTQQLDSAIIENKHLQNSLADANTTLKLNRTEYEKSRKEVDGLKQQLQHYVEEVRRIEQMLTQKEAERSEMLEQFASLSVEANMLENTNLSLETESASKSIQLQSNISKIQSLESKLSEKATIIEKQSDQIATMNYKITALENEIKLLKDEKRIMEHNVSCLKQMCSQLQSEPTCNPRCAGDYDTEVKLYENKIRSLTRSKAELEVDKDEISEKLATTEALLSNARKEIVELKLALQDATSETKSLQGCVNRLNRKDTQVTLTQNDYELKLPAEESISDTPDDEEENLEHHNEVFQTYSHYMHGDTI